MITLKLHRFPPPWSAWYNNARGRGRVKTKLYIAWQHSCAKELLGTGLIGEANMFQHPFQAPWESQAAIIGEVKAEYIFRRPDKRRRDLGNLEKAVSDTLVKYGVIEDDSLIVDLRLRWGGDSPVTITIREAGNG